MSWQQIYTRGWGQGRHGELINSERRGKSRMGVENLFRVVRKVEIVRIFRGGWQGGEISEVLWGYLSRSELR